MYVDAFLREFLAQLEGVQLDVLEISANSDLFTEEDDALLAACCSGIHTIILSLSDPARRLQLPQGPHVVYDPWRVGATRGETDH